MIKRANWKLLYGAAHPAQLYNLAEDLRERADLAADPGARTVLETLVAEAVAKWNFGALQADIELSIARRLLVRNAHAQGRAPDWDFASSSGEADRWCRSNSDYNDLAFAVL